MPTDLNGREYARLSQLAAGDLIQVDGDFDCLIPWSTLTVVDSDGDLAVIHNTPECGACGGTEADCPHTLDGQLMDDGDSLVGIYKL